MNIDQIPEIFKSSDTIYHYTKLETAIEHILYEGQLRLSPRKKAYDPIESIKPSFNHPLMAATESMAERIEHETSALVPELKRFIEKYFQSCKQLCFCKNKGGINSTFMIDNWEDFGFMKPRMWDQYGNHYQGVCLAFSKSSLIDGTNVLHNDIEYVNYRGLPSSMYPINRNVLYEHGLEKYKLEYKSMMNKQIFKKHQDYEGESEYRFCISSQSDHEFIGTKKAFRGIFIYKEFVKGHNLECIHRLADKYDIDVLSIDVEDRINVDSRLESKRLHDLKFKIGRTKNDA